MKTPTEKTVTKNTKAVANAVTTTQMVATTSSFANAENVPQKLQSLAQNGPEAARLKVFQNMANQSIPSTKAKPTGSAAPIQAKLSINKKNIENYDANTVVFNKAKFSATVSDIAMSSGKADTDITQKIDDMANSQLTHAFVGTNGEQLQAISDFMQHNVGVALPNTFKSLRELQTKTTHLSKHYRLLNTFRVDRPSGLASTEELGIMRNKDDEAKLKGTSTQVIDTDSDYTDTSGTATNERLEKAKNADKSSIQSGTEGRVTTKYAKDIDPSMSATAFGLGGEVQNHKTLRTHIRWAPAESNEGTHMIADPLGPDHTLGSMPKKGKDQPWNLSRVRMEGLSKMSYVAGHLLNEQLGGPGDDVRNLAPITSEANAQHKERVENEIKRKINKHMLWMYYEVRTQRSNLAAPPKKPKKWEDGKYTSSFECIWGQLDEDGNRIDKRTVTLDFADPSASKGATTVTNDGIVHKLLQKDGAQTVRDYRKAVLNTKLKIKSYLIASQTLLPVIEGLSQQLTAHSEEWQMLQRAFAAYDPTKDILEDAFTDVEEDYNVIDEAIKSEEAMKDIYKPDINDIKAFTALRLAYSDEVTPLVNKQKQEAYLVIDDILQKSTHSILNQALANLKRYIEHYRHPTDKIIADTLNKFHQKHSERRLSDEQKHSSKKEEELSFLQKDHIELERDYSDLRYGYSIVKKQKESRTRDLDREERENEHLRRRNEDLHHEIDDLREKNDDLRWKNRNLYFGSRDQQRELQEKDDIILQQARELQEMRRRLEEMERERAQNQRQLPTGPPLGFSYNPQPYYQAPTHYQPTTHTPHIPYYHSPSHTPNDFKGSTSPFPQVPKGQFNFDSPYTSSSRPYAQDDYPSSSTPQDFQPFNLGNTPTFSSQPPREYGKKDKRRDSDEKKRDYKPTEPKKYKGESSDSPPTPSIDASDYKDAVSKIEGEALNFYQHGNKILYQLIKHIQKFSQEPTQDHLQLIVNEILVIAKQYPNRMVWLQYLGMG